LDLIEYFLASVDSATQDGETKESLGGNTGSWSVGLDYFRLDGSTSSENRNTWCKIFNREDNHRFVIKPSSFILSTSSTQ
jgi:transcriptional regulator ATRX